MCHQRLQRGDVHRNILQNCGTAKLSGSAKQNSRLAVMMCITADRTVHANDAGDNHFFADFSDDLFQQIRQRLSVSIRTGLSLQLVRCRRPGTSQKLFDALIGQEQELVRLSHLSRFALDLDHCCSRPIVGD